VRGRRSAGKREEREGEGGAGQGAATKGARGEKKGVTAPQNSDEN